MYEGGIRVPGAARCPGRIQPGSTTERMSLTMDIFATACEALGVPLPRSVVAVEAGPSPASAPLSPSKGERGAMRGGGTRGVTGDIDGVSFWPTLLGQPEPELKRDLYFIRREGGAAYGGKTIEAFRRGDWKLVQDSPFAPLELYDLKSDPKETTDLAGKERQIFNQLSSGLRKQIQRGGQTAWQPPPAAP